MAIFANSLLLVVVVLWTLAAEDAVVAAARDRRLGWRHGGGGARRRRGGRGGKTGWRKDYRGGGGGGPGKSKQRRFGKFELFPDETAVVGKDIDCDAEPKCAPLGGGGRGMRSRGDGVFVCRTIYSEVTGKPAKVNVCIDPLVGSIDGNDACGCCTERAVNPCPAPCECTCSTWSNWRRDGIDDAEDDEAEKDGYYVSDASGWYSQSCMRKEKAMTMIAMGEVECDCPDPEDEAAESEGADDIDE